MVRAPMPRGGELMTRKRALCRRRDLRRGAGRRGVFDFLAFVKAQAAVDFCKGNAAAEQALFDNARLGVAAVEDRRFRQIQPSRSRGFGFVHDELGFFEVGKGGVVADFVACFGVGAQVLPKAFVVIFDNGVGGGEDVADGR